MGPPHIRQSICVVSRPKCREQSNEVGKYEFIREIHDRIIIKSSISQPDEQFPSQGH